MNRFDPEHALSRTRREFGEHGGVTPSISRSSTFTVIDPATMPEIFHGLRGPNKNGCFLYSRHFNPTVTVLSRYLAAMEATGAAMCTASGMSAIACTLLQLCRQGDHIVASNTIYGGTHALLDDLLPEMGITTTFVDPFRNQDFENAINARTKVLYVETMGNPTLHIADLPTLGRLATAKGLTLVVDNTFTPMLVTPALHGAHVVVYSMTKFINGASDVLAGAICSGNDLILKLKDLHTGRAMLLGPTMDPRSAFDMIQRLPHLAIRMREHGRRAMAMAQHLEQAGVSVIYPGLASHPQHGLFKQLINPGYGYGGVLAVDCGTQRQAEHFMSVLQNEEDFGYIAVSLGYYDTLMSCSSSSTSSEIPPEDQEKMGLSPGLVRLSIGYSGTLDDRLRQMDRAIRKAGLIV
jgi:methionine-gamma-lyase